MSDYVRGLREKIGHDLLFLPSAHAVIRDDAGCILLVQHVEGRWVLPGGQVEPGETPADAVRRECLEEAGIVVDPIRIAGVYGGPEYRFTYSNGDEVAWVVTIFEARLVSGEPAPSDDETIDARWFTVDGVDALETSSATRTILQCVRDGVAFQ